MDARDVRRALGLALGFVVGIGLVTLATGDRPGPGFVVGILLVPFVFLALSEIDGPLEQRTARIGAIVVTGGLLGAALWLL